MTTGPAADDRTRLAADHFDGRSARSHRVALQVADASLQVEGDGISLQIPLADVRWPERTRHGARVAHFRSGGSVQGLDAAAWDAWARQAGIGESRVVKAQQTWRSVLLACAALLVLAVAGFQWGVPWAARAALALVPASADQAIGDAALRSLDNSLLLPSQVSPERQQQLREALAQAVARADPTAQQPTYQLRFHASPALTAAAQPGTRLGPNAFALPGGVVVVTDEMLQLLAGRDDVLIGVLGHELGHVRRRHGMRLLVQATLIGTAASLLWGDFSSVLAAAPALLGQSAYSRDFEREADDDAITLLRANGISPVVMAVLFERLAQHRRAQRQSTGFDLGIALASHPADEQRIQRFREAAAR